MNFMRFITKNDGIYDKLEIINEDKSCDTFKINLSQKEKTE